MAKTQLEKTDAPFVRKDLVTVTEQNIRPWDGTVSATKWSSVSGWWVEIERDDTGMTYTIPAAQVAAR